MVVNARADHQADVGDVVLVVGGEGMILRHVDRRVRPAERVAGRSSGRWPRRRWPRWRPPAPGQWRHRCARARPGRSCRYPRSPPCAHPGPRAAVAAAAMRTRPARSSGWRGRRHPSPMTLQFLIFLGADEGPAAPVRRRAQVAEGVAVGHRRVAEIDQLSRCAAGRCPGRAPGAEPGHRLGIAGSCLRGRVGVRQPDRRPGIRETAAAAHPPDRGCGRGPGRRQDHREKVWTSDYLRGAMVRSACSVIETARRPRIRTNHAIRNTSTPDTPAHTTTPHSGSPRRPRRGWCCGPGR